MGIFHGKGNKFVQTFLYSQCLNEFWFYWTSGSTKMHSMEARLMLLQLLCLAYRLHCPSSVYWIMSDFQKQDDNSHCDVAYRRLFFYHRLAHGPAYPRNTDYRLVKLHCSMFLQVALAFFIHHLSNLMHHSRICLCYKSNIYPTLWFADRNGFLSCPINILLLT